MDETLSEIINSIPFNTEKELPFMPGYAIKTVIEHYNIPAIKWGHDKDYIGIETKKQFIVWQDEGWRLVFIGLMNKEEISN